MLEAPKKGTSALKMFKAAGAIGVFNTLMTMDSNQKDKFVDSTDRLVKL